jgi:hypothetical protein
MRWRTVGATSLLILTERFFTLQHQKAFRLSSILTFFNIDNQLVKCFQQILFTLGNKKNYIFLKSKLNNKIINCFRACPYATLRVGVFWASLRSVLRTLRPSIHLTQKPSHPKNVNKKHKEHKTIYFQYLKWLIYI